MNVRSAPSTDSEKVDSFSTGKVLTILETLDGWYKVEEGYVSADYVTIIDAAEGRLFRLRLRGGGSGHAVSGLSLLLRRLLPQRF